MSSIGFTKIPVGINETTTQETYYTTHITYIVFINLPHVIYGSFLTVASCIVLILAILTIVAIYKSGNLSKAPIYVLTTWSLLDSVLLLLMFTFYIGPAILFQTYWPDSTSYKGAFNHRIGEVLQAIILSGSIFQTIIAINRLLAFRNSEMILSLKMYNFLAISVFLLAFALSYGQTFLLVCCKSTFSQDTYGLIRPTQFIFENETYIAIIEYFDYGRAYVNIPVHILATIIPIACYSYIFGSTFYIRYTIKATITSNQTTEIIRSIQFATIFFFYACYWIYETLNYYYIDSSVHLYMLITFFLLLEAIMNTIINATSREVRPMIKRTILNLIMFRKTKVIMLTTDTFSSVTTKK